MKWLQRKRVLQHILITKDLNIITYAKQRDIQKIEIIARYKLYRNHLNIGKKDEAKHWKKQLKLKKREWIKRKEKDMHGTSVKGFLHLHFYVEGSFSGY